MRLLCDGRSTHFVFDDEVCALREPDAPLSARQLFRLNLLGMLALVAPADAEPITKARAAFALDTAVSEEQV
jgi:hypothetical protein